MGEGRVLKSCVTFILKLGTTELYYILCFHIESDVQNWESDLKKRVRQLQPTQEHRYVFWCLLHNDSMVRRHLHDKVILGGCYYTTFSFPTWPDRHYILEWRKGDWHCFPLAVLRWLLLLSIFANVSGAANYNTNFEYEHSSIDSPEVYNATFTFAEL